MKKVVYCSAFGPEYLNNVDTFNASFLDNWDPYVITNQKVGVDTYKGWKVMEIRNRTRVSNAKMARFVKTHPHIYFPNYELSLWFDTKFTIKSSLDEFADRYLLRLPNCKMTIMDHNKRNCIYDEAVTISEDFKKFGKPEIIESVNKQIEIYRKEGMPAKFGLLSTGITLRFHNDENVKQLMELWWKEIRKYSPRDMISLPYIVWKHNDLWKATNVNVINFTKAYERFINRR